MKWLLRLAFTKEKKAQFRSLSHHAQADSKYGLRAMGGEIWGLSWTRQCEKVKGPTTTSLSNRLARTSHIPKWVYGGPTNQFFHMRAFESRVCFEFSFRCLRTCTRTYESLSVYADAHVIVVRWHGQILNITNHIAGGRLNKGFEVVCGWAFLARAIRYGISEHAYGSCNVHLYVQFAVSPRTTYSRLA